MCFCGRYIQYITLVSLVKYIPPTLLPTHPPPILSCARVTLMCVLQLLGAGFIRPACTIVLIQKSHHPHPRLSRAPHDRTSYTRLRRNRPDDAQVICLYRVRNYIPENGSAMAYPSSSTARYLYTSRSNSIPRPWICSENYTGPSSWPPSTPGAAATVSEYSSERAGVT